MAQPATDILMFSSQGIRGLVVVEVVLLPAGFLVAFGTVLAKFILVYILGFVAGIAVGWCLAIGRLIFVACSTYQLAVATMQREISVLVVKQVFVDLNDVSRSPQVIAMALFAFHGADSVIATMEPDLLTNIDGDFLMAFQAQSALRFFAEGFVAGTAIVFIFCMRLNHLAGHDQGFKVGGQAHV